jgi:GNAT superfamily N-acetyltransferase
MTTSFSLRTSRDDILHHLPALSDILASCVNGGASVSFMLPFAPHGDNVWQRTADSVAAGERIVLAALDADARPVGTVQLIISQPENQPHRADVAKLLVHQNARRQGIANALMAELEQTARRKGKTCWCWTRRPAAGRSSSMFAAVGKKWGNSALCADADGKMTATSLFYKFLP